MTPPVATRNVVLMSQTPTERPRIRSLADDLRRRSTQELATVIARRPDVLRVTPQDVASLAVELARQQSVRAAMVSLSVGEFAVLTELCSGDRPDPDTVDDADLLRLWEMALVWGGQTSGELDRIRPVSTAVQLLNAASPAELSPRATAAGVLAGQELPRAESVDSEGVSAALELIMSVTRLCELWARDPAPAIQSGELAHRGVTNTASVLELGEGEVRAVIDLALASHLVAIDERTKTHYRPTLHYETWKQLPSEDQWVALVEAQLGLPDAVVWQALAMLPAGHAATSESLMEFAAAVHPADSLPTRQAAIDAALGHGELIGAVSRGAATQIGRALVASDRSRSDLIALVREQLPPTTDTFIAQADLTIVVPALPTPSLRLLLVEAAELESTGGAHVYRFTKQSLSWALRRHHGADQLLADIRSHSLTPLPQPLEYLIHDCARTLHDGLDVEESALTWDSMTDPVDEQLVAIRLAQALRAVDAEEVSPTVMEPSPVLTGGMSAGEVTAALRLALHEGKRVWLSYADDSGNTTVRAVDVIALSAGVLIAFDCNAGRISRFAMARIADVQPVNEGVTVD